MEKSGDAEGAGARAGAGAGAGAGRNNDIIIEQRMTEILDALGINDRESQGLKTRIISYFRNLPNIDKLEIVSEANLRPLLTSDANINRLGDGELSQYLAGDGALRTIWNTFKKNLALLQGYAILRSIQRGNCNEIINTLLTAFNNKISVVNNVLATNLEVPAGAADQLGGASRNFSNDNLNQIKSKFWKYKFKNELIDAKRRLGSI